MISAEGYAGWRLDTTRDDARVILVELDHAIGAVRSGHGRRDSLDTLNEVTRLLVRTYRGTPGLVEVTWQQPRSQTGYLWEVWVNGAKRETTGRGNYRFTAPIGSTAQVAVASVLSDGRYSKPWTATINVADADQRIDGGLGSWARVGEGAGSEETGTVLLSSRPYLDAETNRQYDDWLKRGLAMETSLRNSFGVGDVDALNPNPDRETDWLDYRWRGYECRWYHGDQDWPREHFRRIATAMIGDCRLLGPSSYRFDLIDAGLRLRRSVLTSDRTFTGTVRETLDELVALAGMPPIVYSGIAARGEWSVRYEMRADTRLGEAVRLLVRSIGAHLRVDAATGDLEVLIPDASVVPPVTIVEDDVLRRGVRMTDVTPAYSTVKVVMGDENKTERLFATGALTGDLDETLTVQTALRVIAEADALGAALAGYHVRAHPEYEIRIHRVAGALQEGDRVNVDHYLLRDAGLVTRVARQPLGRATRIEVTV